MESPAAQIVDLAAYRARKAPPTPPVPVPPAPAFKASKWPDNDFNELGHRLARVAEAVRTGTVPSQDELIFVLDSYSVSAFAASETIRNSFVRRLSRRASSGSRTNKNP